MAEEGHEEKEDKRKEKDKEVCSFFSFFVKLFAARLLDEEWPSSRPTSQRLFPLLRIPAQGKKQKKAKAKGSKEDVGDPPDSRLRRQTNFLCHMQFFIPLRPPPLPLQILDTPIGHSELGKFSHFDLHEDQHAKHLPLENGIGASLDPLEMDDYAVPEGATKQQLSQEDADLFTEINPGGTKEEKERASAEHQPRHKAPVSSAFKSKPPGQSEANEVCDISCWLFFGFFFFN